MTKVLLTVKWIAIALVFVGLSMSVIGTGVKAWLEIEEARSHVD